MPSKKINKKQLEKGAKVEMEHAETIKKYMKKGVSVKTVARAIASDHLTWDNEYYKKLMQIEKPHK